SWLTLLHVFQFASIVAALYCVVVFAAAMRRRAGLSCPRLRVFAVAVVIALFLALVTQRKIIQYVIHLTPWLALLFGILVSDVVAVVLRIGSSRPRYSRAVYAAGVIAARLAGGWVAAAPAK